MSALGDTLAALARVLDARGFGWYVFGAQAVAIRGAPRATQDIDITVAVAHDQLEQLLVALRGEGLRLRFPDQFDELLAAGSVIPLTHSSSMEVDLVVMKVLAGRGKDLDDVRSLLAAGDVDVDEATDLLSQLEEALGQSDLVRSLELAVRDVPDE